MNYDNGSVRKLECAAMRYASSVGGAAMSSGVMRVCCNGGVRQLQSRQRGCAATVKCGNGSVRQYGCTATRLWGNGVVRQRQCGHGGGGKGRVWQWTSATIGFAIIGGIRQCGRSVVDVLWNGSRVATAERMLLQSPDCGNSPIISDSCNRKQ